jgi:hypothetical protein
MCRFALAHPNTGQVFVKAAGRADSRLGGRASRGVEREALRIAEDRKRRKLHELEFVARARVHKWNSAEIERVPLTKST